MDDDVPKENPPPDFNKLDLTQLQGFSFGTQWTQDKREPGRTSDRGERPNWTERRSPSTGPGREGVDPAGAPRRDRRSFRKPADAPGDGGREAPGRGAGPGFRRPAQREEAPYDSPHFAVTFYPEDTSFNALVKTIRASCRTIELFEIARTVLGKPERFTVFITRKDAVLPGGMPPSDVPPSGTSPSVAPLRGAKEGPPARPVYVALPDGLPFETEEAAIAHVVERHLDRFFDRAEVEIDPPKGNYLVINRCGITGELLGPPNYHRYSQIVQQHHAAKVRNLSLEAYRGRIETVRDPETVQQWLDKMKKAVRYTWKTNVPRSGASPSDSPGVASAKAEASAKEGPPAAATDQTADQSGNPLAAELASPESPPAGAAPSGASVVASAPTEAPAKAADPAAPPSEQAPVHFDSLEEARQHLLAQARDKVVRPSAHGRFHGRELAGLPHGEIRRAIEGALERQRRFPLDTANALRGRLRRERFTIFKKGSKGISYVCAVKRKFRVSGQVLAESIGGLIAFIEAHPMVKAGDLAKQFLGIAGPAGAAPDAAVAPGPTAGERERMARLHTDLVWLVREGYVTELIDGSLYAPPPMADARKAEVELEEHDPEGFPEAPAETLPAESPTAAEPLPADNPTPAEPLPANAPAPAEAPVSGEPPPADSSAAVEPPEAAVEPPPV